MFEAGDKVLVSDEPYWLGANDEVYYDVIDDLAGRVGVISEGLAGVQLGNNLHVEFEDDYDSGYFAPGCLTLVDNG